MDITLRDMGFTTAGGSIDVEKFRKAWMAVYLMVELIRSTNPEKAKKLEEVKDLLAKANELIEEILEGEEG